MWQLTIIGLGLEILAIGFGYASSYWQGYYETEDLLFALSPFIMLPILLFSFLILLSQLILSLIKKKFRIWASLALVFFCAFICVVSKLSTPGDMLAYGLRNRIMHNFTLEELRQFARDVDKAGLIKSGWINHGDISGLTDEQKSAFAQIREKYPFMHWMDDGRGLGGPSLLNYEQDNVVDFEWGGALAGHWGCSISVDGSKNVPDSDKTNLRVSDDIYFFYGD